MRDNPADRRRGRYPGTTRTRLTIRCPTLRAAGAPPHRSLLLPPVRRRSARSFRSIIRRRPSARLRVRPRLRSGRRSAAVRFRLARSFATSWSNRRPWAESRRSFRTGRRPVRPDGFHRQEQRLGLQHHAFAAAERAVVHGLVAVGSPIAQIVDANVERAGVARPLDHAMLERPLERTPGRSSAHGRSRLVQFLQSRGQIRPRCGGPPARWPRRSRARRESAGRLPPPARPSRRHPAMRSRGPSDAPLSRSTTSQPIRSDSKYSPGSSSMRAARGTRTSHPLSSSASDMVSTPRNLKIRRLSWNQADSTSWREPSGQQIHLAQALVAFRLR